MNFVRCEKDNVEIIKQDNSVANVKSWLEKTNPGLKILDYTQTINWDNAIITNGDKGKIIEVPILLKGNLVVKTIDNKDYYTYNRLMFLEKEGVLNIYHIVITTTDINFDNNNKLFNFYNIPQDFFGLINVINTKNEITDTIDRTQKTNKIKNTYKIKDQIEVGTCIILVEVFSDGSTSYIATLGCFGDPGGGYDGTGYGGSGGNTGAPNTTTTTKTPCEALKEKLKALAFLNKIADLKTKTNLLQESGYDEKLDGTFTPLINSGRDGLLMPLTATTIGFNHNHINPYLNGKFDNDGEPMYNEPIKMFSPQDLGKFLEMIQNAANNGIPLDKIYGTMVTNSNTYTLSFTGDPTLIHSSYNWNGMVEEYTKKMTETYNLEDTFIQFIKDKVGIEGIVLSKINTTEATVITKTMNETGQIIKTNCN